MNDIIIGNFEVFIKSRTVLQRLRLLFKKKQYIQNNDGILTYKRLDDLFFVCDWEPTLNENQFGNTESNEDIEQKEGMKCYFVDKEHAGGSINQRLYLFDFEKKIFEYWNLTGFNLFFQGSSSGDGTFAQPALKSLTDDDEIDLESYLAMRDEWFNFHLYLPTKQNNGN